jgi:hypothetical protein
MSNDLLEAYMKSRDKVRESLAKTYLDMAKVQHYKNNYVAVSIKKEYWTDEEGNTHSKIVEMTPVFNKLMLISEMRAFEVQQVDYKDRFTVFSAVDQSGLEGATPNSCRLTEEFNKLGDTTSKLKFLVKAGENEELTKEDINAFLELIPPKYKDYYNIVGIEIIKACSYIESEVKKRWRKEVSKGDIQEEVVAKIYDIFSIGKKYSKKDIKDKLKELYQKMGYEKTPKTTDLDLLFVMKDTKLKDSTGKWVNGLEILGKR